MAECDRLWKEIFGNEQLKSRLASETSSGKLAHAYLVEGSPGSGRFLLSKTMCAVLSGNLRDAQRIQNGLCPDVHIIEAPVGKRTIGIDQIRSLRAAAAVKPNELEFQAFIVKNAHQMTIQAQNALLKLLEEPPGQLLFLLLCDNASALLATVRSRAPVLRMQSFSETELKRILLSHSEKGAARYPEAAALADRNPDRFDALLKGCTTIGAALEAFRDQAVSSVDTAQTVLAFWQAVADKRASDIYLRALSAPSDRSQMDIFLKNARLALRDMAVLRQKDDCELCFGYEAELRMLARKMTAGLIIRLDVLIVSLQRDLASNANLNSLKTALAYGCRKLTQ